jgi:hypothetical protein
VTTSLSKNSQISTIVNEDPKDSKDRFIPKSPCSNLSSINFTGATIPGLIGIRQGVAMDSLKFNPGHHALPFLASAPKS